MGFFIRHFLTTCLILYSLALTAQESELSGHVEPLSGSVTEMMIKPVTMFQSDVPVTSSFVPGFPEAKHEIPLAFPFGNNREFLTGPYESDLFTHPGAGSNDYPQGLIKRKNNLPWLAFSAIPFAAGGVASHFRTKALHRDYVQSVQTDEAVRLHKEVKQMQLIRNASFGVAGLLGVTGALFHKKQYRNNKRVRIEYLPFACGGSIGITF